jgi:hypothetical protein
VDSKNSMRGTTWEVLKEIMSQVKRKRTRKAHTKTISRVNTHKFLFKLAANMLTYRGTCATVTSTSTICESCEHARSVAMSSKKQVALSDKSAQIGRVSSYPSWMPYCLRIILSTGHSIAPISTPATQCSLSITCSCTITLRCELLGVGKVSKEAHQWGRA